jgi:anti-anti-sigma factor
MLFLAPLFSDLPKAVLAAVIIDAVVFGMIDVPALRRLFRVKRFDFWIAVAAIVGVLTFGVLAGVVIGIVLSIIWLVYVSTRPNIVELGNQPGTQVFRDLAGDGGITHPGLVVLRFDGGLFFANADALQDRLRDILIDREPPVRTLVIDCGGVNFIDSQGAETLRELHEVAEHQGLALHLSNLKSDVREVLAADGLLELYGEGRIHAKTYLAVEAHLGD